MEPIMTAPLLSFINWQSFSQVSSANDKCMILNAFGVISQIVAHLMHMPNIRLPICSIATSFSVCFSELRIRENNKSVIGFIDAGFYK